jgi:hypothetical protein
MFSLSSSLIKTPFKKYFSKTQMPYKIQEDLFKCLIEAKDLP